MMTLVVAMTVMMMKQRGDGVKRIVVVCQRLMRYMCSNQWIHICIMTERVQNASTKDKAKDFDLTGHYSVENSEPEQKLKYQGSL